MDAKTVRQIPLFQSLSPRGRKRLLSGATLERYGRGAVLFRQGERADAMWIILEGWVHLVRSAAGLDAARAVVLCTITPEERLCGLSAVESGTYQMSAVVASECRAIRIASEPFVAMLAHEPRFAYEVLRLCARRMRHMAQQYGSMAEPVPQRLIRAVLRLRQQFGPTLPVTHRELGQMAWTTTESAIRIVRRLKRRGWLAGTRGRLTVANPKALEGLLRGANGHWTV